MKSLILFLCLVKLDEIIVEQKDCIVIDIRLDDKLQIRILLRERRRIRKRNRKQINAENDVNDP